MVGVDQERAELVAEPERSVRGLAERLDIEVSAGQQPAAADLIVHGNGVIRHQGVAGIEFAIRDDGEVDFPIGVAERDERMRFDGAATAVFGAEVRFDPVDAQHVILRVVLGAESIVAHHQEVAVPGFQHR